MSTRARYGLFFLGAYLVFLIGSVPAAQVYQWATAGTPPGEPYPVELYQASGTLWSGRAAAMRIGAVSLERPAWSFRPAALLLGRIEFNLAAALGNGTVDTVAGRTLGGGLYARDMRLSAPLREVASLAGEPDMGLTGRLNAAFDRLLVREGLIRDAGGRIDVDGAGLGPPLNVQLGGFSVLLETDGEGITRGTLQDTGGALQATGTLTLQPSGEYQLNASLAARERGGSLAQALDMIGTPDREGRVAIAYSGRIEVPGNR